MMRSLLYLKVLCSIFVVMSMSAQSTVTTSGGTAGTVPLFSGTATLQNSLLTQGMSAQNGSTVLNVPTLFLPDRLYITTPGSWLSLRGLVNTSWTYDIRNDKVNALTIQSANTASVPFAIDAVGNVGVGTNTPKAALDVNSGIVHVAGKVAPSTGLQGAYLGWNMTGGQGETDFINNQGSGSGGFQFVNVSSSNGAQTKVMTITANGSIVLGSGANITFSDGTIQSTAGGAGSCPVGGDYAESVDIYQERGQYEPGDLIAIDIEHPGAFIKAAESYSHLIAGVYSTKPGFIGRRQAIDKPRSGEIPM